MLSTLKAMAKNLGKTGSLVDEARDQDPGAGNQKGRAQGAGLKAQKNSQEAEKEDDDPFADLHGLPQAEFNAAVRERVDKLLDDCAAEGQKKTAANGNGVR